MKAGVFFLFLLLLIACENNDMSPSGPLPVREIHTLLSTGEQLGIKTYTYEGGKLVREYFQANPDLAASDEIVYEYDLAGRLIKRKQRNPQYNNSFGSVVESTYKFGQKVREIQYMQDKPVYQTLYYYTGARLDSAHFFSHNEDLQEFWYYLNPIYYTYNDADQLIEKFNIFKTSYTYDQKGNLLTECENSGDTQSCSTINEYDSEGRITKWKFSYQQGENNRGEANREEYFYAGSLLTEKRIWNYPMYGDINQPFVTRVQYEY